MRLFLEPPFLNFYIRHCLLPLSIWMLLFSHYLCILGKLDIAHHWASCGRAHCTQISTKYLLRWMELHRVTAAQAEPHHYSEDCTFYEWITPTNVGVCLRLLPHCTKMFKRMLYHALLTICTCDDVRTCMYTTWSHADYQVLMTITIHHINGCMFNTEEGILAGMNSWTKAQCFANYWTIRTIYWQLQSWGIKH